MTVLFPLKIGDKTKSLMFFNIFKSKLTKTFPHNGLSKQAEWKHNTSICVKLTTKITKEDEIKKEKEKVKVKESSTAGNVSALFFGVVQCFIWPCKQTTFLRVN